MEPMTKTATIKCQADMDKTNDDLNEVFLTYDRFVWDVIQSGGGYTGDCVGLSVRISYNNEYQQKLAAVIPMNAQDDVDEMNRLTKIRYDAYTKEEQDLLGLTYYYTTDEHIEFFREKLFNAIKQTYQNVNKPTTGSINVAMKGTYRPEDK